MSDQIELSSSALLTLSSLNDGPKPLARYAEDDVEELRKALFIRDLPTGRIGITKEGVDFLMPPRQPQKPQSYVPPVQRAVTGSPFAPLPAKAPAPAAPVIPPVESEKKKRGPKPGFKRTPKAEVTPVPVVSAAAGLPESHPYPERSGSTTDIHLPELPAPAAPKPCAENCADCPTGRALAFLTSTSPMIKAIVERYQQYEADLRRLQALIGEDGS